MKVMDCTELPERLMDELMDGIRDAVLADHQRRCRACRDEATELRETWELLGEAPDVEVPSRRLRRRFEAVLRAWEAGREEGRSEGGETAPARRWDGAALRLAAALGAVALGVVLGWRMAPEGGGEVAALRGEVRSLSRLVASSLLKEESVSRRLQGVRFSSERAGEDGDVLSALLSTLREDPSVNVRLAAVDALSDHLDDPVVRRGLVTALGGQGSPLVQLELVGLLQRTDGPEERVALRRLAARPDLEPLVRRRIEAGLHRGI